MPDVCYTVTPADLHAHLYAVVLEVPEPDVDGQVFVLPTWVRGSYKIRDFARHVIDVAAFCGKTPVAIERLDKSTLRCAPCTGVLRLEYRVHAHDASVREAFLDTTRGFFNPSSLCYRVLGRETTACEFVLVRPSAAPVGWRAATALPAREVDIDGFGRYRAESYAALIDHPFALGPMQLIDFDVHGIPHQLALSGRCEPDVEQLRADLVAICSTERALFDDQPTLDRYLFLCNVQPDGYGGLEHRSSAALVCSRDDLPRPHETTQSRAYRGFLGLVSHEYFHQWNVKRITPERFAVSELDAEAYTRDLWAYEGVTSYYDDLFLLRAGRVDAPVWLDLLAATATRYQRAPGRHVQTLADASFEAWTKFYQPDANTPNATVSYYLKGALVALCLDLRLRHDTHAKTPVCLDDVMRALWQRYGASGEALPEGSLERVAEELAGVDLKVFFDLALRSTEALPLAALLADFGIDARLRVSHGATDRGGRSTGHPMLVDTGLKWSRDGQRVIYVRSGSAAEQAGLAPGDVPVALDGLRVDGNNWQARLDALHTEATLPMHYFRGDELLRGELRAAPAEADAWVFTLDPSCDAASAQRRRAWLGV